MSDSQSKFTQDIHNVDEQVIQRACAGDQVAMELIYQTYAGRIYALLYRMVSRREIAQELMQDSFIDVLKNISTFRGESSFYSWLRRIAVNRCLMHFRKNKAKLFELDPTNEPEFNEQIETNIDLEKLLRRLTPKRRMIVWLHEVEGLTHKEIANTMGKSVSFSKTELSRALSQLRQGQKTQAHEMTTEKKTVIKCKDKHTVINEVGLCTPLLNNS